MSSVEFIGEKPTALDILSELGNCQSCEFLGAYEHPDYPGSNDWTIRLYAITTDGGYVCKVAATNGESVWDESDDWDTLMESYQVEQ